MMHFRTDEQPLNSKRTFACGIGPGLPAGDTWMGLYESGSDWRVDCPKCNPNPRQLGTPLSQLRGNANGPPEDRAAYERFKGIAASWGYD